MAHYRRERTFQDSVDGAWVTIGSWEWQDSGCETCPYFEGTMGEKMALCATAGVPCGGIEVEEPLELDDDYVLTPADELRSGQQFLFER